MCCGEVAGWGGGGVCLLNDHAILMAPSCSWWWVWGLWLWWNGLWEDLGVSLPSRLSMSAWGRNRKYKINVRLLNRRKWKTRMRTNEMPNQRKKERKKERKKAIWLYSCLSSSKILVLYLSVFFFNAFHLSGCSQHFFGRGLKKKQLTNSHFGINSCCNQRLETLILSIALVNKKSSRQTEARMVPNRDCGVSVYTINLHFLGSWTQLAISWRHSPLSPHN